MFERPPKPDGQAKQIPKPEDEAKFYPDFATNEKIETLRARGSTLKAVWKMDGVLRKTWHIAEGAEPVFAKKIRGFRIQIKLVDKEHRRVLEENVPVDELFAMNP